MQLAGPAGELLGARRPLTVPRATPDAELPGTAVHRADSDRHSTVPARADAGQLAAQGHAGPATFEQLVLGCLQRRTPVTARADTAPAARRPGPSAEAVPR